MYTFKGYISFPTIFTPDYTRNAEGKPMGDKKRYKMELLIPSGDPQITKIQAIQDAEIANKYPSGKPHDLRVTFMSYDDKYRSKSYYDPKMSGYYCLSLTAKETDKPVVVDSARNVIVDPGQVYPGAEVYVSCGITSYAEGKGGIGAWLNGVMLTGGECPLGRLDNKPTVDQMFAGVEAGAPPVAPPAAPPVAPPAAPAVFPPEGWLPHPSAPGYFYKGQEVMAESDLRASIRIPTSF